MFNLIFQQALALSFRKGGGAFGSLGFYVIICVLFTFALGAEGVARHAGAVLCVALLLASIVQLPQLFERDYDDGTLEQFLLQPAMLELLVLAKLCGQFAANMLPLLLISPLLLLLMSGVPAQAGLPMLLLLALAAPSITCIGAIGAALTLGARRGGLLQALIVMPLYIPVLIFASVGGAAAVWFLGAILCAVVPLSCWICAGLIGAAGE